MSIKKMTVTAVLTALMTVLTCTVTIPLGTFGFFNLSDFLIMLLAGFVSPLQIIIIGGVGCALADIFLSYAQYAIFTLVIKSLEGLVMMIILKKGLIKFKPIVFVLGALTMMVGYGLVDSFLGQSLSMMIPSMTANLPQGLVCAIVASICYIPFDKFIGSKIYETK